MHKEEEESGSIYLSGWVGFDTLTDGLEEDPPAAIDSVPTFAKKSSLDI